MKRFWDKLCDKALEVIPAMWGTLLIIAISCCTVTFCVWSIKSLLHVLGVL